MEEIYNEVIKTETNQSNLLSLQSKARQIKKDNRIKIDLSKTEYPLLRNVSINDFGWKIWTREESKEEISVYWMDTYISQQHIRRMRTYQRINHFPSSENLGKKNLLTANLNRMKKILQRQYVFYPQTFNFPSEAEEFQKLKFQQSKFFIVKPGSDSQGRGIYLTRCRDLNVKEQVVVQEYIQNPLLIEGMKFDLRIYVLLKSLNPLKIYIYHEGLSRLATCTYQKPSTQNQKNMRMHLTNYAINKFSPNFIFNKSEEEDHIGHKRSYTATMKALEKMGCDIDHLQIEIDKIIVKTIMATYQILNNKYKELRDIKQQSESVCFQILGFDILIKDNFEPILLEVNHSPSFATDSPLDLIIKRCLILDTLNMLSLNHEDKVSYLKNKSYHDALHIFPQTSRNNRSIRIEPEEIGAYRKIYPLQNIPQNQQLNNHYDLIFKNCRIQKLYRPLKILPVFNKIPLQTDREANSQASPSKNSNNDNHQTSFTLYNVINNLKTTRRRKFIHNKQQDKPIEPIQQLPQQPQQKANIFEPDINTSWIRKQELLSYEKKIRKDKQKEKKKYVLPMPINNVSIKLDQKYLQPKREVRSTNSHFITSDHNYIKVHSYFNNRGFQTDRTGIKQKGNQTADGDARLPHFQSFRKTNLVGFSHISEDSVYSSQLKQKLQRMQFVRLRIQKSKKMDKASYIIINNKSQPKKQSQNAIVNDEGFL